jgi:hypothetical protein
MAMNDALHIHQTDAGARKLNLTVQALKYAEEFGGITQVKARTIVANIDETQLKWIHLCHALDCDG